VAVDFGTKSPTYREVIAHTHLPLSIDSNAQFWYCHGILLSLLYGTEHLWSKKMGGYRKTTLESPTDGNHRQSTFESRVPVRGASGKIPMALEQRSVIAIAQGMALKQ
jgi:hypothetical protein